MIDFVTTFMEQSPFGTGVGLRLDHIEADRVRVVLPDREAVTTIADVVHGGAISTLIDVAATAATWSGAEPTDNPRGATSGLTVDFLRAARGADLVAKGLVSYKLT